MVNNTKLITFIIALKRYRLNSVILKIAKHKMARQINLSPVTFDSHLQKCIDLGWISFSDQKYQIKDLQSILSEFNEKTGLFFNNHDVLKSFKHHDFKKLLPEIEQILLIDNIIAPQQYRIKKKSKFVKDYNKLTSPTVPIGGKTTSSQKKMMRMGLSRAGEEIERMNFTDSVVTSARHTAKVLGFSVSKSNKVLNFGGKVHREIVQKWVHGISWLKIEEIRREHPKATIIPYVHYNKIKVCFGSALSLG